MFSYMTVFQIKEKKTPKNKTSAKHPGVRVGDRDHSESLCNNSVAEQKSDSCLVTKAVLHLKAKII